MFHMQAFHLIFLPRAAIALNVGQLPLPQETNQTMARAVIGWTLKDNSYMFRKKNHRGFQRIKWGDGPKPPISITIAEKGGRGGDKWINWFWQPSMQTCQLKRNKHSRAVSHPKKKQALVEHKRLSHRGSVEDMGAEKEEKKNILHRWAIKRNQE